MSTDREDDAPSPLEGLTLKERRFVDAYLGEAAGNGTRAAQLAGYRGSATALGVVAYENLRKPKIRDAIARLSEDDPLIIGRVERMRRLSRFVRGEVMVQRMAPDGTIVELPMHPRDQARILLKMAELAGDFRQPDQTRDTLPPNLTIEELFALAGIDRPRPPRLES